MNIFSWNVNGIRAIYKKGFMDWLAKEQPDILGLQETKAHPNQLPNDLRSPNGYYSYWHLGERKGYSGVAIFTKEKPLEVVHNFGAHNILSHEGRTILARYQKFTLINAYFPNGKRGADRLAYKMKYYHEFLRMINKLRTEGQHIIFCGDVNTAHKPVDLARPKENEKIS